jgi:hypothetical protein
MVAVSRDGGKPGPVPELALPDEDSRAEQAVGAEIHQAITARRKR